MVDIAIECRRIEKLYTSMFCRGVSHQNVGFSDLNGVLKASTPGSLSPRHRHLLYLSRQAGRRVIKVSPYDKTGQCYGKLEDVSEKARAKSAGRSTPTIWAPSLVQVEVVNLIISPKIGMDVLTAMKKQGIRFSNS